MFTSLKSAGRVRSAFHTEIHNLEVAGQKHIANMSDPKIPAALAPAVAAEPAGGPAQVTTTGHEQSTMVRADRR